MEVITNCIACNDQKFKHVTSNGDHFSGESANMCMSCGLIFLSPRMTEIEINNFYHSDTFSEKFRGSVSPTPEIAKQREKRGIKAFDRIEKYLDLLPGKRVLEIGCSSGYFLNCMSSDYEVFGIDPSEGFLAYAESHYGLNVCAGMFPNDLSKNWGKQFDLIALFHVLEHTFSPNDILSEIHQRLTRSGLVIIEVPDVFRLCDRRWFIHPGVFQKSHLWDFNGSVLELMLANAGFEIVDLLYYGTKPPEDKNVLVIAKKTSAEGSKNPITRLPLSARKIRKYYHTIKFKLFLGRLIYCIRNFVILNKC